MSNKQYEILDANNDVVAVHEHVGPDLFSDLVEAGEGAKVIDGQTGVPVNIPPPAPSSMDGTEATSDEAVPDSAPDPLEGLVSESGPESRPEPESEAQSPEAVPEPIPYVIETLAAQIMSGAVMIALQDAGKLEHACALSVRAAYILHELAHLPPGELGLRETRGASAGGTVDERGNVRSYTKKVVGGRTVYVPNDRETSS